MLTKLALALYTGIKEKTAKIATSAQMVLSPLICFSISFNVVLITDFYVMRNFIIIVTSVYLLNCLVVIGHQQINFLRFNFLQTSYSFFKLTSSVFIVLEQVETSTSW